jgi:hypothetical protein
MNEAEWLKRKKLKQLVKNLTIQEEDFDSAPFLQGPYCAAEAKRLPSKLKLVIAPVNEALAT